ncbi:MAG: hypothetical protein KTR32_42375 [Granulosicoccus sp.]|nr:hypothetical protein [Granulosicoccus sp.]
MGTLFKPLFKYWYLVLILALVAGLFASFEGQKVYESRARILLKLGEELLQSGVGPDGRTTGRIELAEAINTEVQIMTSYDQLYMVVTELGTDLFLDSAVTPEHAISEEELAITQLRKGLNVRSVENSAVIHMTYEHTDPSNARKVLSTLIDVYLRERLVILSDNDADVLLIARNAAEREFLRARDRRENFIRSGESSDIESTLAALRDTHAGLVRSKLETEGLLLEDLRKSEILDREIAKQPRRVSFYSESRANAGIEKARERLGELRIEEQQLLISYTSDSQAIQRIRGEILQLEEVIAQNAGSQSVAVQRTGSNPIRERLELEKAELTVRIAGSRARVEALVAQELKTRSAMLELEQRDLEYARLREDFTMAQTRFRAVEDQYMNQKIMNDMHSTRTASIRVIEKPSLPAVAAGLSRSVKVALGAFIGFLVGWILAVWVELLRSAPTVRVTTTELRRDIHATGRPRDELPVEEPKQLERELPVLGEFRLIG